MLFRSGIIIAVAIDSLFFAYYEVEGDLYEVDLRDMRHELERLQSQKDSLENVLKSYRIENDSLSFAILLNEQKYKELKNGTSQKVDSVHDLPLDLAIEYFTNQVSEEGHLGW